MRSFYSKREKGRDVGEHAGQDERVFGVVAQHGLQQLHALIYGQLLQFRETGRETENMNKHPQTDFLLLCIPPLTSSSRLLRIDATVHSMRTVIASHWTTDGDSTEQRPSLALASKVQREKWWTLTRYPYATCYLHIQVLDTCWKDP